MSIVVDVNRVSKRVAEDENTRGSWSIDEKLKKVAEDGDIDGLYELIAKDPNILNHFDKETFCETPLHIAAEKGQTHLAMELMTLKPSLALKLNMLGFSPIHLALQNNHVQMVRGFVAINSGLVSIKGRGRVTPLHHVARVGDAELLSEFLFACPSSINDLTIKCETSMHIAVKNNQFMAFKVLLGWVKRANKEEILDWKDENGNTIFHIAASINQTEMMKLLRKTVKVEAKNLDGKTAMDMLQTHQSSFSDSRRPVENALKRLVCCYTTKTTTLAAYLCKNPSFIEKQNTLLGLSTLNVTRDGSPNIGNSNRRDAILVVAILIVTATYQACLSPPGGYWQDDSPPQVVGMTVDDNRYHKAGQMTMPLFEALCFNALNGVAFFTSLYVIIILIIGLPMWKLIYGSVAALGIAMFLSYDKILPMHEYGDRWNIVSYVLIYCFPTIIGAMVFGSLVLFMIDKRRRRRVDFPASSFTSPDTRHQYYFFLFTCLCFIGCVIFIAHFYFLPMFKKSLGVSRAVEVGLAPNDKIGD